MGDTTDTALGEKASQSGSPKVSISQKVSWATVAQRKKGLTKYDLEIVEKDGIGTVEVPDEVFTDSSPLWEDFLIGKFLDKVPHIAKVHAIVNKIWSLGDKNQMIDVIEVNSTTMKFRIESPTIRNRVVRRGMWNLAGIPVVLTKWVPFIEEKQPEVESVPMWIHLRNVPVNWFSWKGLSCVASPVGEPVRLHPETAQCLDFKVAKIFVKVDLTKELPKSMNFNYKGKETLIQFSYPWMPTKCTNCNKWGHLLKACEVAPISKELESSIQNIEGVNQQASNEKVKEAAESNNLTNEEALNEQVKEIGNEVVNAAVEMDQVKETSAGEEGWSTPTKAARSSPKKDNNLELGMVSILSNSRFSVLSQDEEEGEILAVQEDEDESAAENPVLPTCGNLEEVTQTAYGENSTNSEEYKEEEKAEEEVQVPSDSLDPAVKTQAADRVGTRQSLPRESKNNHRFIKDMSASNMKDAGPPNLSKKNSSRNH